MPTIHMLDRELKFVLAGVFETTPKELFICLGGGDEQFDDAAKRMMEWHLRTLGYKEEEFRPLCWTPKRVAWVRKERWPEDKIWIKGDVPAIIDYLETVCD